MSVFIQGVSISEIKQNKKTKKSSTAVTYDGNTAEISCNNNGKKTFMTLNNNQLKNLMTLPASKKTLKQRLTAVARGSNKKKRRTRYRRKKKRSRKKKGGRTKKKRGRNRH